MRYLTLEEVKKQCVIDPLFEADDNYLQMVGDASEDMAEQLLDCSLDEIYAQRGELPATIRHAIRMLCDYFYSTNRGSADNDKSIPDAVTLMLKLYRQYN